MRKVININKNWNFYYKNEILNVNLPHTWNGIDGQDGGGDYLRDSFLYTHILEKVVFNDDELLYIEFDGVNSSCEVYINDVFIGKHDGGYSRFRFDITKYYSKDKENVLKVKVNNIENDRVYPQLADFTFYGGIYRDVNLIKVNKQHFDLDFYGSKGIKIDTYYEDSKWFIEVSSWNDEVKDFDFELINMEAKVVIQGKSGHKIHVENVHRSVFIFS